MNITIKQESILPYCAQEAIEEYAIASLEIHIDSSMRYEAKRHLIIHAILENYCRSWPHEKIEELEEFIADALIQLDEGEKK